MFEVKTRVTFDEYKKYALTVSRVIGKFDIRLSVVLLIAAAFAVVLVVMGMYWYLLFWVVFWCAYISFLFYRRSRNIQKQWNTDKLIKDADVTYRFDDDGFEMTTENSSAKVTYSQIHILIETQTHFYIMTSLHSGCSIGKADCTHEQCLFIKEHCGVNGTAKA